MTKPTLLLPALQPYDWPGQANALSRPLVPVSDLAGGPWVGFGYYQLNGFDPVARDAHTSGLIDGSLHLVEQAAIRNLRSRAVHWKIEEVRINLFRKMRLLICGEDALAAERILDQKFLQEAQAELHARQLAVGIPCRGLLMAADGSHQDDSLTRFSAMVSAQYHRPRSAPISPQVFLVQSGVIIGLVTGQEEAGLKLVEGHGQPWLHNPKDTGGDAGPPAGLELFQDPAGSSLDSLSSSAEAPEAGSLSKLLSGLGNRSLQVRRKSAQQVARLLQSGAVSLEQPHIIGRVSAALVKSLADEDGLVRSMAAEALAQMGSPAIEPLKAALAGSADARAREYAVIALAGMDDPHLMDVFLPGLSDTDPGVRRRCAAALVDLCSSGLDTAREQVLFNNLSSSLADKDPTIRSLAASGLGRLGNPGAVELLIQALCDTDGEVNGKAAYALGEIKDQRAVPHLVAILRAEHLSTRIFSIWALGEMGEAAGAEALVKLLMDPQAGASEAVRSAVISSLHRIGKPAVEPLKSARSKIDPKRDPEADQLLAGLLADLRRASSAR